MTDEKILKDEVLDDKELEKVSGGSWENIVDDANRFKRDFGIDFATKYYQMVVNIDDVDDFVRQDLIRTFGKCGVRMEFNNESENKYFIGDKEVTRDVAFNRNYRHSRKFLQQSVLFQYRRNVECERY